ncbi:MAG: DNA polymerase III subunit delta' [Defluviitaleaceae bacterium]|nr:DNA polymerase III subunit delta' [Defluviitaleaceae bacterium]
MYSFQNVVGNEHVVRVLQGALCSGRIGHALCMTGKPGTGRKLISYAFAKALQCEDRRGGESCGICRSCVSLEAGTHPDVFRIRSDKSSVGVDIVRERIVDEMAHKPHSYPYKIFVVEEASALTVQAQNAMLKTLEEPCGYGVILLIAERADSLLPTIRSRCLTYSTRPVGASRIAEYLNRNARVTAEDAEKFAQLAHGSIGRAMRLATDDEFSALRKYTSDLAVSLAGLSIVEAFSQTKELERYKHRIADVLDILSVKYRDALVVSETGETSRMLDIGISSQVACSRDLLLDKLAAIDNARARLRFNGNFQLVMDSLLLTLRDT